MFILVHQTQTYYENRKPLTEVVQHLVNLDNVENIMERTSDGKTQINFVSDGLIVADETFEEMKNKIEGNIHIQERMITT